MKYFTQMEKIFKNIIYLIEDGREDQLRLKIASGLSKKKLKILKGMNVDLEYAPIIVTIYCILEILSIKMEELVYLPFIMIPIQMIMAGNNQENWYTRMKRNKKLLQRSIEIN